MLKCGRSARSWACGFVLCLAWLSPVCATAQPAAAASSGPYDVRVLAGGVGLDKPLPAATPWLRADAEWTMRAWVRPRLAPTGRSLIPVVDAHGQRLLPAYYSDNYVSLLPGESRQIEIRGPSAGQLRNAGVQLRGWNVPAAQVPAQP